jgi:hypothetical protein
MNEDILWPVRINNPDVQTLQTSLATEVSLYTCTIFMWSVKEERENLVLQIEDLKVQALLNNRTLFFTVVTVVLKFPPQQVFSIIEGLWSSYNILDVLLVPVSDNIPQSDNRHRDREQQNIVALHIMYVTPYTNNTAECYGGVGTGSNEKKETTKRKWRYYLIQFLYKSSYTMVIN